VWTLSCLNIAVTSDADEEAVTGQGIKVGATALSFWRVLKSTMGMGEWTWTGVLTGTLVIVGQGSQQWLQWDTRRQAHCFCQRTYRRGCVDIRDETMWELRGKET
jgi:hypothetical protein